MDSRDKRRLIVAAWLVLGVVQGGLALVDGDLAYGAIAVSYLSLGVLYYYFELYRADEA